MLLTAEAAEYVYVVHPLLILGSQCETGLSNCQNNQTNKQKPYFTSYLVCHGTLQEKTKMQLQRLTKKEALKRSLICLKSHE